MDAGARHIAILIDEEQKIAEFPLITEIDGRDTLLEEGEEFDQLLFALMASDEDIGSAFAVDVRNLGVFADGVEHNVVRQKRTPAREENLDLPNHTLRFFPKSHRYYFRTHLFTSILFCLNFTGIRFIGGFYEPNSGKVGGITRFDLTRRVYHKDYDLSIVLHGRFVL